MPARRRSRGYDRRHNTSSLVHSSDGTYTQSVSLSPSLLSFSLRLCPSRRLSLDSFRTYVCFLPLHTRRAYTRGTYTTSRDRTALPRTPVCVLSRLSFFSASLAPRVEGNSRSLLLLSFASPGRPRKHTPRQGDLLGETSSSTQPWTRFLCASLLQSPSVSLIVRPSVRPSRRLPLLHSSRRF